MSKSVTHVNNTFYATFDYEFYVPELILGIQIDPQGLVLETEAGDEIETEGQIKVGKRTPAFKLRRNVFVAVGGLTE